MDDDIDTSWIDAEDVIEKEMLENVTCFYIYLDVNKHVNHIEKITNPLAIASGDTTKITKTQLLGLIQSKKNRLGNKYRLLDILQYNIPYDFTDLIQSNYSNMMSNVTTDDEILFNYNLDYNQFAVQHL